MAGSSVTDIHEHGICVDKKKSRVKCNHCGKEMTSFSRLRCHLGGVGTDVTHCDQVSLTVREMFRAILMEDKSGHTKRVGNIQMSNSPKRRKSQDSSSESVSPENGNMADKQDLLSNKAQMCIGRFFYEHCVDLSAVDSPCFKEMMMAAGGGQMRLKIPDSHALNGWMLQEAFKEAQAYVKKIKDSWEITGCSILLDAWIDQKGRDLVTFVADCPAGPVYLKSFDVSDIKHNVADLLSLVSGLVEDVGVRDVTQIIACSTSGWVGELGKLFAGHDREVFWSVSLSHCFELMLVKIVKMHSFGDILEKVNNIWEFINNNKVCRDRSHGIVTTVSSSEFEFVTPYLTLENIFKAKENLVAMFASFDRKKEEGKAISDLVNDSSFWENVDRVRKCTSPLIHGLLLFSTADNQHVGYIYDTMDGIKENIAKEFSHEKQYYEPFWNVIDDVWNNRLHNPLHATGYFLNPTSFYSTDFHLDPEVASGLTHSLVHVAKEGHIKIAAQLDKYRLGKECFNEASQADQISGISPTEWWTQTASQYPELQSFAIKILSQTCEGASRYKLKRSLAEKLLLTEGMSHCEQKHLEELAFVHYNLHLQSCKAKLSEEQ
ncbi:uncharacterized protein LOC111831566 [Capsella rubella]|uniref:uncharacterized protein LOC111831566 n=1 Tax=Capsella rubella TaxID=81985 RepID=UPI000CD5B791|nr:uncharacterized protein LOC111831566 [Capsella rubella]XP_023641971.1 uncharacterized protein LOC111831566 [Capsella rubella]